jgi:photosystem II stability/assembly factor-like uncharacterized protein
MKRYPVALALVAALSLSGCVVLAPNGSNPGTGTDNASKQASLVITSFTANPSSLRAGDQLSLSVEAVSSAGRTLTYTWTATSGILSATSGKIVNWTSPTTPGTYTVAVSVTDGIGNQAAGSLNVVVSADGNASVGKPTITQPSQSGGGSNQIAQATWSKAFGVEGFNAYHFTNFNLGWVTQQDGKIRHTTDAGVTWRTQFAGTKALNTIFFADANNGWAGGDDGTLLRTSNEGNQWTLVDWEGAGTQTIRSIQFKDLAEGLMLTSEGLYRSIDGGINWNKVSDQYGNSLRYFANGKAFLADNKALFKYESGSLTRSTGIGDDVNQVDIGSIAFPDPTNNSNAYLAANYHWRRLYKTTDGGSSFTEVTKLNLGTEFASDFSPGAISFAGPQVGMIVEAQPSGVSREHFYAYTTSDGGVTWTKRESKTAAGMTSLLLFDANHAWASDGGSLYRYSP